MTTKTTSNRKYWLGSAVVIAIGIALISTAPSAAVRTPPATVVQLQAPASVEKEVAELETIALDSKLLQPGMKDIMSID